MRKCINSRNQKIKADADKLMLELIPPSAIFALGRVLTYGAKKYGSNNWQQVEQERYVGALLRHLYAFVDGEEIDQESGLPHLEHVLTNAVFLVHLNRKEDK